MQRELERTLWRGMEIGHPPQWELAVASGVDEPGRTAFADRYLHRLDVRWRPLKYVPNLDKMLERHRRKADKDQKLKLSDLTGGPPEWRGVVRQTPGGTVVHAGRFFREARLLVEAAVVWPKKRNRVLENAVLASIRPQGQEKAKRRDWQAMGLSLTAPEGFELRTSAAKVGKVRWEFDTGRRNGPQLTVERIALPEYWLTAPLREWLGEQLGGEWKQVRQDPASFGPHRGERLLSRVKLGPLDSLRGRRRLRVDAAWQCPVEGRVYHVSYVKTCRAEELSLPAGFAVRCCRAVPQPAEA